jgi:hypothetical protein
LISDFRGNGQGVGATIRGSLPGVPAEARHSVHHDHGNAPFGVENDNRITSCSSKEPALSVLQAASTAIGETVVLFRGAAAFFIAGCRRTVLHSGAN